MKITKFNFKISEMKGGPMFCQTGAFKFEIKSRRAISSDIVHFTNCGLKWIFSLNKMINIICN